MDNPFRIVDDLALEKYESKLPSYGESWKTKTISFLQERLHEEVKECLWEENDEKVHQEALDVMNLARMIAERTREL